MNRSDFQSLSRIRQKEAEVLLAQRQYAGAYYLLGYSVECALKSCVCRRVNRFDFPDRDMIRKAYTHDMVTLATTAGILKALDAATWVNPRLGVSWATVKDWTEECRYSLSISGARTRGLYRACVHREYGVLPWIRRRW